MLRDRTNTFPGLNLSNSFTNEEEYKLNTKKPVFQDRYIPSYINRNLFMLSDTNTGGHPDSSSNKILEEYSNPDAETNKFKMLLKKNVMDEDTLYNPLKKTTKKSLGTNFPLTKNQKRKVWENLSEKF